MRVEVKYDGRRLNRLARNVGFVSGRQFIQRTSFAPEKGLLLAFLKRITPRSKQMSNRKEFGKALADSWKVSILKRDFAVNLRIESLIEQASKRGGLVYNSIQYGNRVYSFTLKKSVSFLDYRFKNPKRVFLKAGYTVYKKEKTEGLNTRSKVDMYVRTTLEGVIRRKVRSKLSEAITAIQTFA